MDKNIHFPNSYLKAFAEARPVVSWLKEQKRIRGAYLSTQVRQPSLLTILVCEETV